MNSIYQPSLRLLRKSKNLTLKELSGITGISFQKLSEMERGKIDYQTLSGKAPAGIARLAKKYNKRVIAVSGSLEYTPELDEYFDEYYEVMNYSQSLDDALTNVREYLRIIGHKINNILKE